MEQVNKQWKNGKAIAVLQYIRLYFIMAVVYCYLEKENYKVLKFHMNNFSYFETRATLHQAPHPKA